jgi:hypothetical protein
MMMEKKSLRKDGKGSKKEPEKSQFSPRPFAEQEDENECPDLKAPGNGSRFGFLSGDLCPSAMKTVQCKLALGQADDRYEREADGMARRFMSGLSSSELQGKPAGTGHMPAPRGASLKPDLASAIQQSRGQGQPLPNGVRQPMERAFGTDFSEVRVHEDGQADSLNRSLGAWAFTTGKDVFFRDAAYRPGSYEGRRLLAHEMAHVVQQSSIKTNTVQRQKLEPFEEQDVSSLKPLYEVQKRTQYSCIGILNKAVGTLYSEELKGKKLGSTIQDTMKALRKLNIVGAPVIIEFFDASGNITTGMKEPKTLSQSIEQLVLSSSAPLEGWYLYGLSIMDGYHSVLLAVDATVSSKKVYWLDQTVGFEEITGNLDARIENKTNSWWQGVLASKGERYRTRATIWFFNVVLGDFPTIPGEAAPA